METKCYYATLYIYSSYLNSLKLSQFDLNFLRKKVNGKFFHAGDQAINLAILLSNRLGEKMYTTMAPITGLP